MARTGKKNAQASAKIENPYVRESLAVVLSIAALYILICLLTFHPLDPSLNNAVPTEKLHNSGGLWGAYLSDLLIMLFGLAAFIPPILLFVQATGLMLNSKRQNFRIQYLLLPVFMLGICALLQMFQPWPAWPNNLSELGTNDAYQGFGNGGLIGQLMLSWSVPYVGWLGSFMLFMALSILSLLWILGAALSSIYALGKRAYFRIYYAICVLARLIKRIQFKRHDQFDLPLTPRMNKPKVERPKPAPEGCVKETQKIQQSSLPLTVGNGAALPPLSLLERASSQQKSESEEALTQNARRLEAELKNFGVTGQITSIKPGPVITIYELEPAAGVKTSQVINLADDLARAMSALSIRIAPIPGRNVIGIEMPNRHRQSVSLRFLLENEEFETHSGKLTAAIGVDTSGSPMYEDISKMPHALIAGTTGSGKSVAMNSFIISLLYRMPPEQLRFVMIDPKMLELSIYNDIPHLLTPVITDPSKAAGALNWVVKEMENRYRQMSELGVKNITSFNAKFTELQDKGEIPNKRVQTGFDIHTGQPTYEEQPIATGTLPFIVVVIDELADLMMVAGKQVEVYIARLTQMARASGIHLLVATQRPSVDVVTGLIKSNIPTRISFSVASKIDSRTVLDAMGAEQLLGKGDMLMLANGSNSIKRYHGAFVSEEECQAVAGFLREQGEPQYIENVAQAAAVPDGGKVTAGEGDGGDELYQQAVEVVAKEQKASTSFLQRHLKIGYNRAADLIDKMESDGLISTANHVGKREVIIKQPPEGGY